MAPEQDPKPDRPKQRKLPKISQADLDDPRNQSTPCPDPIESFVKAFFPKGQRREILQKHRAQKSGLKPGDN
jgi:hypothetical protein